MSFGVGCWRLALRACIFTGLLPFACAAVGVLPSLAGSLPRDMIDSDLAWPLPALALCGKAFCCNGAVWMPFPPLEGELTTFNDSAGRCPLFAGPPFALLASECCLVKGGGLICATELFLLCGADCGAMDDLLVLTPEWGASRSSSSRSPGGRAMFLKVMMHSISSPAYTVGSFQCTKARIFDGGGGGGMVAIH